MTSTWSINELRRIAETDGLHISPFREDGETYGTPAWIWSVVVDDALYVRAYNGQNARWYKSAMRQKAGRITAAGMTKEVSFELVDGEINHRIDGACRAKYKSSPYLDPMIGARARGATVTARQQRLIVKKQAIAKAVENQPACVCVTGWPNAFSAVSVVKDVVEKRSR